MVSEGTHDILKDFEFGENVRIYQSCSTTVNGRMMIFGGAYFSLISNFEIRSK